MTRTNQLSVGAGAIPIAIARSLSGLTPGVEYHARLGATNAVGTVYSDGVTLIIPLPPTPPEPPLPPPPTIPSLVIVPVAIYITTPAYEPITPVTFTMTNEAPNTYYPWRVIRAHPRPAVVHYLSKEESGDPGLTGTETITVSFPIMDGPSTRDLWYEFAPAGVNEDDMPPGTIKSLHIYVTTTIEGYP